MQRLDEHWEWVGAMDAPDLEKPPSEYFRSNCYLSCEADEDTVKYYVDWFGDDNVVFSTDYPHSDSKYPHSVTAFMMIAPPVPMVWLPLNVEWSIETGLTLSATIAPPPASHSGDSQVASLLTKAECETLSAPNPSACDATSPTGNWCDPRTSLLIDGPLTKMPPPCPAHPKSQSATLPLKNAPLTKAPPKTIAPPPVALQVSHSTSFWVNTELVIVNVPSNMTMKRES